MKTTRCWLACLLLLVCRLASAQQDQFSLNFKDVDIRALIETVADATGKNFIVDPRITGNITVVTSTPMKADQVYDVFLSILKVHGYAAVANGNVVKIVPNVNVKQDGEENELRASGKNGDEQLTRVVTVHHIDAAQVVQTLMPLMPQYAFMGAVPDGHAVILSDTAANVERLVAVIRQIDKSDVRSIEIVNLQHARASDLIQPLNNLIVASSPSRAMAVAPPLVADDRTNAIIIGGDPDQHLQLRALIANLDAPVERDGNTEVIRMRHAMAKDLVQTLTGVGSKKIDQVGNNQAQSQQTASEKNFDIRADEASNALIITAPQETLRNLKAVVKQLDVRRAQVHIEAIIAEVSYDKLQQIGIEWQTKQDGHGVFGSYRKNKDNSPDITKFISSLGKGLNVGYLAGSELAAMVNAMAIDTDVNILSTPSLVTLDNEEASMMVGENIPLTTGKYTPSTGTGVSTPFQTIQREDVGIKLKVLPQINEGDAIKLKVTQEVSSVKAESDSPTLQKRHIETTVVVDDGKVLVLGGLIKDDFSESVDKVPLLSDIPLLGSLFQSNSTALKKTNLMVFLRPQILRDEASAADVTTDKYGLIQNKQREFNRDGVLLMPNETQPLLAPLLDSEPQTVGSKPAAP